MAGKSLAAVITGPRTIDVREVDIPDVGEEVTPSSCTWRREPLDTLSTAPCRPYTSPSSPGPGDIEAMSAT